MHDYLGHHVIIPGYWFLISSLCRIIRGMALFQKNPHSSREHHSLYTLGLNKTLLIVGLGNPGKKYEGTRHNIGFTCVDALVEALEFGLWTDKKDLRSQLSMQTLGDVRVILCKPMTYMNLSGQAVQATAHFYKITPEQMVVVHDELDIPFGQIRMRAGGSSAGHNGVRSLMDHVGENFNRVRVGVGSEARGQIDGADFVLAKFTKEEQAQLKNLTHEVISILTEYIYSGTLAAETRSFMV